MSNDTICNVCNYVGKNPTNLKRHLKTKKHQQNMEKLNNVSSKDTSRDTSFSDPSEKDTSKDTSRDTSRDTSFSDPSRDPSEKDTSRDTSEDTSFSDPSEKDTSNINISKEDIHELFSGELSPVMEMYKYMINTLLKMKDNPNIEDIIPEELTDEEKKYVDEYGFTEAQSLFIQKWCMDNIPSNNRSFYCISDDNTIFMTRHKGEWHLDYNANLVLSLIKGPLMRYATSPEYINKL